MASPTAAEPAPRVGGALALVPVLLLLAVPLAVDPAAQLPFFGIKWLLVCGLVPAGLAVTAGLAGLRWPAWPWWAGWLGVLGVATLVGVAPRLSALGAPQRNVGLLAWAVMAGAFVLGASTGDVPVVLRWVARAATVAAGLVGAGAVLDRIGVDVFGLGDLHGLTRARSSWGSATFAAGHLVLVTPLAVLHLQTEDRRWRAVGVVATGAALTGLLLTGTRGAWLGAVVAALVLAWPRRAEIAGVRRRRLAAIVAGALVAVAVAAAVSSPTLGRSTASGRLDLWRVSAAAAADRPVLGAGPDAQRVVVPAHIDDAFERDHGSEEIHDRAHDLLLDTVLTTGLIGLVAYGALLLAVGRLVLAAARAGAVGRALAAGLAGYLVHLLTAFSEASLDPLAWLLAGTAAAVGLHAAGADPLAPGRRAARLGAALALAVVALAGVAWAGGELIADHQLRRGLDQRADGRSLEALATLDGAERTAPARFDILQVRARLAEEIHNLGYEVDLETTAIADLDAALRVAPGDSDLLVDRASALASAGHLDEARAAYEVILAGPYPSSSRAWLGLGVVAASEGDPAEAQRSWDRAADLAPHDPRPWVDLGLLHEQAGDTAAAGDAYRRALEIDPTSTQAADGLARVT